MPACGRSFRASLVDDDENIVASVSLALESHGHTVKAFYDGYIREGEGKPFYTQSSAF